MVDSALPQKNSRDDSLEELRSNKVGVPLKIVDDLNNMGLNISEIETVLGTCGLNNDCAIRFGTQLKEKKHLIAHP